MQTVEYITERVRNALDGADEIYAAILMGSCSRHEESYEQDDNGELHLLSDYEFTIVTTKNTVPETVEEKLKALNAELKKYVASPFFNLEWNYVWKDKLPFMDKRFINFEMAEAKCLICGNPGVFSLFPKITIANLNFAELNAIVNHRLYHVLKDFGKVSEHHKKYLIARNTLDILSVILPYEGTLICSYTKRLEKFPKRVENIYFSNDIEKRLSDALEMKKNYSSPLYKTLNADRMLEQFITDMKALYRYQSDKQGGKAFCVDRRRLLKSVLKLHIGDVKNTLRRPHEEEKLYEEMIALLETRAFEPGKVSAIADRMQNIYGYC